MLIVIARSEVSPLTTDQIRIQYQHFYLVITFSVIKSVNFAHSYSASLIAIQQAGRCQKAFYKNVYRLTTHTIATLRANRFCCRYIQYLTSEQPVIEVLSESSSQSNSPHCRVMFRLNIIKPYIAFRRNRQKLIELLQHKPYCRAHHNPADSLLWRQEFRNLLWLTLKTYLRLSTTYKSPEL